MACPRYIRFDGWSFIGIDNCSDRRGAFSGTMLVRNISIRELIVHAVASVTLLPDCVLVTRR
jgi:hypothetical protein